MRRYIYWNVSIHLLCVWVKIATNVLFPRDRLRRHVPLREQHIRGLGAFATVGLQVGVHIRLLVLPRERPFLGRTFEEQSRMTRLRTVIQGGAVLLSLSRPGTQACFRYTSLLESLPAATDSGSLNIQRHHPYSRSEACELLWRRPIDASCVAACGQRLPLLGMTAEMKPCDRVQSNRILSRFRCGV